MEIDKFIHLIERGFDVSFHSDDVFYTISLLKEESFGKVYGIGGDNGYKADFHSLDAIPVIDNDSEIQRLNKEANELWVSLFTPTEFTNENPSGYVFDADKEKEVAPRLLKLVNELVSRLDEINDGTFVVEDRESGRLEELTRSSR